VTAGADFAHLTWSKNNLISFMLKLRGESGLVFAPGRCPLGTSQISTIHFDHRTPRAIFAVDSPCGVLEKCHGGLLMKKFGIYLKGKWVQSASHKTFQSTNPANGEVLATFQEGTAEDLQQAVEAGQSHR
jgi:hypothetical protein